jgi:hypothetical protein
MVLQHQETSGTGRKPTITTTQQNTTCTDQWSPQEGCRASQGAIMLFDISDFVLPFFSEINTKNEQGPIAVIVVKGFSSDIGVNSNYVELVMQAAADQLACALEVTRLETDRQRVLKHAVKELEKGNHWSRSSKPWLRAIGSSVR